MTLRSSDFLGRLATVLLEGSPLKPTVSQLDEQIRSAADVDRQVRAADVTALLGESGNPLLMITQALAAAAHIADWTTGLDADQVVSNLQAGRSVGEVALRHGLASIDAAREDHRLGFPVEMMAKTLRSELSLPQRPAERVSAHFAAAYLLVHFVTTAGESFPAITLTESTRQLATDERPVAVFVRTFWA